MAGHKGPWKAIVRILALTLRQVGSPEENHAMTPRF